MRKRIQKLSGIIVCLLAVLMLSTSVFAASGFETVDAYKDRAVKTRIVNGTEFTASYYSGGYQLTAVKNGKTQILSKSADDVHVVSNGNLVYYTVKTSGGHYLYKANLKNGKKEKIKKLANNNVYSISLAGMYKNDVYYIIDLPEGSFAKVNIKTKKIKKIAPKYSVTTADKKDNYFILSDGTGAGYSYLGLWNAAKNRFTKVASRPVNWIIKKKNIYFLETLSGHILSGNAKISVKKYNFATGKTKVLVKKISVSRYVKFTSKYFQYYDKNGKLKTKKW